MPNGQAGTIPFIDFNIKWWLFFKWLLNICWNELNIDKSFCIQYLLTFIFYSLIVFFIVYRFCHYFSSPLYIHLLLHTYACVITMSFLSFYLSIHNMLSDPSYTVYRIPYNNNQYADHGYACPRYEVQIWQQTVSHPIRTGTFLSYTAFLLCLLFLLVFLSLSTFSSFSPILLVSFTLSFPFFLCPSLIRFFTW